MKYLMESGPALKHAHLEWLEEYFGQKLPEDYASFLTMSNGGRPEKAVEIDVTGEGARATDLQAFFGIGMPAETSEIDWHLDQFRARFADVEVLPIACDSAGGLFLLRYDLGKVSGVDYVDAAGKFYRIAQDFSELLVLIE